MNNMSRQTIHLLQTTFGLKPMAVTIFIFLSVCLVSIFQFGSSSAAVAYLQGERLIPESRTITTGPLEIGSKKTFTFRVRNFARKPVTIVGGHSSCSCVVAGALPTTLPPGGSAGLAVVVSSAVASLRKTQVVTFFTDDPENPKINISVDIETVDAKTTATVPPIGG